MKKTLLIAAAALAAGIMTSQAQVYSQNVVGYANVVTPSAGANYLVCVPFKIGVSNGANEVFTSLPEFSQILIWSPITSRYTLSQTDTSSGTGWSDAGFTPIPPPLLPVGQGFFLSPSANNVTNTFAGAVAVNVGSNYVLTLPSAGANYLVGAVVPYAGSVTNGNYTGQGVNLNGLPEFSQVLIWDPLTSKYTLSQTDTSSGSGWSDAGFTPVPPPTLNVGQGLFISPSANNATWTNSLSF